MNHAPLPAGVFMPGTLISLALGALLAAMAWKVAPGWTDIGLLGVYALVYLGLPLLGLWLLAPPLLGLLAMAAAPALRKSLEWARAAQRLRERPGAAEIHVNLSGHDLAPGVHGLLVSMEDGGARMAASMPAASPGRFVSGTRFPIEDGDASLAPIPPGEGYAALYALTPVPGAQDGSRQLHLKARQIRRWHSPPDAAPEEADGEWVPLQAVQPLPDLDGLAALQRAPAEATAWLYVHYPGHTEVAPVIALPPWLALNMAAQWGDLHRIRLLNGGPDAIVRWQVNGQELLVSDRHASQPGDCDSDTGGYLRAPAPGTQPQTWQLRWQTLAAPGQRQEAEVSVPAWPQAQASDLPAAPAEQAVALHRLPDGRWLAQRLRRQGQGHAQQVQATALPEPVACRHADEAQLLQ